MNVFSRLLLLAACGTWMAACPVSHAQMQRPKPEQAQGIGVDQKLGQTVPLEAKFHDDENNYVALGDFFDGKRPVILSFNYSNCPQMCIVQFNRLVAGLIAMDLMPDQDFQIVSISIDWREKPGRAKETKARYLASYGKMATANGWHFLVGNEATIREATEACGIRFRYIPDQDSFSHPAAFIFCSPQGQIVRYLDGLDGELEKKIRPALIEAGEGRMGSIIDRAIYFTNCYEYDPASGKYSFVARRIMMWGGVLTIICLLVGLIPFWIGRRRLNSASRVRPVDPQTVVGGTT